MCVLTLEVWFPAFGDGHVGSSVVVHCSSLVGVADVEVWLMVGGHCGVWTCRV